MADTDEQSRQSHGSHAPEPAGVDGAVDGQPTGDPVTRAAVTGVTGPPATGEPGMTGPLTSARSSPTATASGPDLAPDGIAAEISADSAPAVGLVYCVSCAKAGRDAYVMPLRGKCPTCRQFLPGNAIARRHFNAARREAILAELLDEFQPTNILVRSSCQALANAIEQLEASHPGSPAWSRLVQTVQTLGDTLRESKHATAQREPKSHAHLSPDAVVARLEALLAQAREDAAALATLATPASAPEPTTPAPSPVMADPAPEPVECEYCHHAPCIGPTDHRYEALHLEDPAEIKKRDDLRTREMFLMLGKVSPYL